MSNVVSGSSEYSPSLEPLFRLGRPGAFSEWIDYAASGVGPEHVPDLLRIVADPKLLEGSSESSAIWAPLHAWRALGQLRAESAIGPLIGLLGRIDRDEDDWLAEDLPVVFGGIGVAAVSPLALYLGDTANGLYSRTAAGKALSMIGQEHPAARAACVAALAGQLQKYGENGPELNGFLITSLSDLEAQETLPLVEKLFEVGAVDTMITGDWEESRRWFDPATRPTPEELKAKGDGLLAAQRMLKMDPDLEMESFYDEAGEDVDLLPEAKPVIDLRAINKAAKQARSKAKKAKKKKNQKR